MKGPIKERKKILNEIEEMAIKLIKKQSETKKKKAIVPKQKKKHRLFLGLIYPLWAYCSLILFGPAN